MSDIINILPDSVANQIAAGEVVDRPASAVKELLENALDAGATAIELIIKDAGRTLIQVIDNGCGMSDSDARLCFERHATSKIHKADDLFAIHSMGFRGEALASIAAVSQVELKTRQAQSELGSMVIIEGSDVKEQSPCNCSVGTSIAVKNLFFNIPARRNFLKKDSVELSHIEEVFRRVALAHYDIALSFYHNGKLLYDLKSNNLAQRIAAIFGGNYKERLYQVEEQTEVVSLFGYIGKAEFVRRTRGEQYLFVNGRYIKHLGLSAAIEKAYTELIPERSYPSYFVMLKVDPSRIDVNIHPTKTEVRFIDESVIFAILRAATKKALGQFSLATELEFNPSTEIDFSPAPRGYVPPAPKVTYNPSYTPFGSGSVSSGSTSRDEIRHFFDDSLTLPEMNGRESTNSGIPLFPSMMQTDDTVSTTAPLPSNSTPISYQNRYIITTLKSGVVIIDQQRAKERIIYERLLQRMERQQNCAQQLLFPVNVSLSAADADILCELMPEMKRLGFVIDKLGQNTFVVSAAPNDLKEQELHDVLEQTVSEYKACMMQKFSEQDKNLCLSLARQMAAHDRYPLRPEEMQNLIAELFSCQAPNLSPSGKKTMIIFNEQDLSDRFR